MEEEHIPKHPFAQNLDGSLLVGLLWWLDL